jgi:hypothetical protein
MHRLPTLPLRASRATIRSGVSHRDRPLPRVRLAVNHDRPTIDHRERLWDRARKNAAAPSAIFFQKTESDLTRSCAQRLAGTRQSEGRFLSAAPWSVFLWNDPQARRRVKNVALCFREICSPSRERCLLLKVFSFGLVNDRKLHASDHMRGVRATGYRNRCLPTLAPTMAPRSRCTISTDGGSGGTFAPILVADPKGIGPAGTWCDLILEPPTAWQCGGEITASRRHAQRGKR